MSSVRFSARSAFARTVGAALSAWLALAGSAPASAAPAFAAPPWLVLRPGVLARVDIAPWSVSDEPEAALAESAASMARDFTGDSTRPPDIVFEPIGTRVRVERILPGGTVARVHGIDARFDAYTRVDRLVPEVPRGTVLIAAGGFEGFSDFYRTLSTPNKDAERLETRSRMIVLAMGAAHYDPDSADLVRVRVRITSGALAGRDGWVAVSYTGLPANPAAMLSQPEQTCACRVVTFDDRF